MEITDVEITLANEGQLRAFATITLDDCLVLRELRIIEGPHGLFVAPPGKKDSRAELEKVFEPRILAEYRKVTVMT